jgi:hypothetical protein
VLGLKTVVAQTQNLLLLKYSTSTTTQGFLKQKN